MFPFFGNIAFFRNSIMVNGKKSKYSSKKTGGRAAPKARGPSKALTKAVQQIIHKDAESKQCFHSIDSVLFNSAMNTTGDMQRALPNCALGTTDYQRIGEQIRAQKLNIRGHFLLSTQNQGEANSRIAVRMMVVSPKNIAGYPDVSTNTAWMQQLLRKGASTVAFTGLISDLYAPVNTDQITCYYDKVSYVTMPYIVYTTTAGVTSVNTSTGVSWDLSKTTKFFNISLKVKNKLLKYDENYSSVQPTSYNPIVLIGYSHLNGSVPDVITTQVALSYDSILTYEDM